MLFRAKNGGKIIEKTRVARTFFSRFRGLMFEKKENFDYALVFELPNETRAGASIHMLFVPFPIDVVYLNSAREVVDKTTAFPWQPNYTPKKPAKYFIEMPRGPGKKVSLGEKLDWD